MDGSMLFVFLKPVLLCSIFSISPFLPLLLCVCVGRFLSVVSGVVVLAGGSDAERGIAGFDANNGSVLWTRTDTSCINIVSTNGRIVGVVEHTFLNLFAMDPRTGTLLFATTLTEEAFNDISVRPNNNKKKKKKTAADLALEVCVIDSSLQTRHYSLFGSPPTHRRTASSFIFFLFLLFFFLCFSSSSYFPTPSIA
jgi:hypothetical protein